jgi:hypothetical protein
MVRFTPEQQKIKCYQNQETNFKEDMNGLIKK